LVANEQGGKGRKSKGRLAKEVSCWPHEGGGGNEKSVGCRRTGVKEKNKKKVTNDKKARREGKFWVQTANCVSEKEKHQKKKGKMNWGGDTPVEQEKSLQRKEVGWDLIGNTKVHRY